MNTKITSYIIWTFLAGIILCACQTPKHYPIASPERMLNVELSQTENGLLQYTFVADGKKLIDNSLLGFLTVAGDTVPSARWQIESHSSREVNEVWHPVWGKRKEDACLVAALTNESERVIELPLTFLDNSRYSAVIIEDGDNAHYLTNREAWKIREQQVTSGDTLRLKLASGGGACLTFKKNK
jgi:hypothetical protein